MFNDIKIEFLYEQILTGKIENESGTDPSTIPMLYLPVVTRPFGKSISFDSDCFNHFTEFVNRVDEMLEIKEYEIVGESTDSSDFKESKSIFRNDTLNYCKNTTEAHLSGKITSSLIYIPMPEGIVTAKKSMQYKGNDIYMQNNVDSIEYGMFQSIVVSNTITGLDESIQEFNKMSFTNCIDALKYLDCIL